MKIIVRIDQSEHGHAIETSAEVEDTHIENVARALHNAAQAALILAGFHLDNVNDYFGSYDR